MCYSNVRCIVCCVLCVVCCVVCCCVSCSVVLCSVVVKLTDMEYVMTRTTVLERMTSVAYVMVLELSTSVDVQIFQRETVTVMETSLTH